MYSHRRKVGEWMDLQRMDRQRRAAKLSQLCAGWMTRFVCSAVFFGELPNCGIEKKRKTKTTKQQSSKATEWCACTSHEFAIRINNGRPVDESVSNVSTSRNMPKSAPKPTMTTITTAALKYHWGKFKFCSAAAAAATATATAGKCQNNFRTQRSGVERAWNRASQRRAERMWAIKVDQWWQVQSDVRQKTKF